MPIKKKIHIYYGGFISVKGGVNVHSNLLKNELKKIAISFQRRFRPELIDGKIDNECLELAKNLIKRGLN